MANRVVDAALGGGMKKLLLFAGVATLALTFAFAYVVSPPPPPMLDANRRPLATSLHGTPTPAQRVAWARRRTRAYTAMGRL